MPQNLHRTDNELKTAVADELKWTPSVSSDNITGADGVVTLAEGVGTYPQILSMLSAWSSVNDADLAGHAGEALERAVDIPRDVKVTVHNRDVTLFGSVHWQFQRVAAELAMHSIQGVRSVLNTIQVLPEGEPTDLKSATDTAPARNAEIERSQVSVSVEGNTGTLTGTVLT